MVQVRLVIIPSYDSHRSMSKANYINMLQDLTCFPRQRLTQSVVRRYKVIGKGQDKGIATQTKALILKPASRNWTCTGLVLLTTFENLYQLNLNFQRGVLRVPMVFLRFRRFIILK